MEQHERDGGGLDCRERAASPRTQNRYETRRMPKGLLRVKPLSASRGKQVEGKRKSRQPDKFYGDEP